jgi:hypothetical protein
VVAARNYYPKVRAAAEGLEIEIGPLDERRAPI